jgi:hypothetical protein
MADDGQLDTDGHGRYFTVTAVTPVIFPGQPDIAGVTPLSPLSLGEEDEP